MSNQLANLLSEALNESVKKRLSPDIILKDPEIMQAIKNALNQCISHVLAEGLKTWIQSAIKSHIEKNMPKITRTLIFDAYKMQLEDGIKKQLTDFVEEKILQDINIHLTLKNKIDPEKVKKRKLKKYIK